MGASRLALGGMWLVFIGFPVVDAATDSDPAHARVLAVAFTALYVWMVMVWSVEHERRPLYLESALSAVLAVTCTICSATACR